MPKMLLREVSWLLSGLTITLLLGWMVGWPLVAALLYLLVYSLWLLHRTTVIVRWLQSGGKPSKAPPTLGQMNEVVQLVHREKRYSRKQKHRFRAALAQFHGLASELPDATIVLDDTRQIRWANPAARSLLGVSAGRDRGQRIDNLIRDPEFQAFMRQPDAIAELEMPSPRDESLVLGVRNVPAERGLSVLIARDVTQRVRIREMRKAFVGDVSHELRTPLTVIQGYLEILLDDEQLVGHQGDSLKSISQQADRMRHIVEHLLELSKLEGNPLGEHEGDPIRMSAMVGSLVNTLKKTHEPVQRIDMDLDDRLCLLGTESDLYSACQNLVVNAIKYSGEQATIRVFWGTDAHGAPVFSVSDNGPGIEARHLPRLSERFYRVDRARSRSSGGTGLGLAIVKHVAQRHGGQLHIESTPGLGSSFRVEFPLGRGSTEAQVMNY